VQEQNDSRGQDGQEKVSAEDSGQGASTARSSGQTGGCEEAARFVERLSEEERMLVLLQGQLYEGDWGAMLGDLENRLEGRPYIFKLANRIRDDVARIQKLRDFEQKHQVNLGDFVRPPDEAGQ
jgi:hypothetical protein